MADSRRVNVLSRLLPWSLLGCVATPPQERAAPVPPSWPELAVVMRPVVSELQTRLGIPGIGVALLSIDPATGERRQWNESFGAVRPGGPPLPPDAVFRVASISKLYTATAIMVLVERGAVDLDAPVTRYLPDFAPQNPFGVPVTVRHLLGHRSGLVREGPIGNYFDASEASLDATVAALNATALTHAPGAGFKYSNPGFGVLGAIVERVTAQPFAAAVDELVLRPLQLHASAFRPRADLLARAASGGMWTYDGRVIATPTFAFGFGPAADLRCTTADLTTFASSWFAQHGPRLLSPPILASMWQPAAVDSGGCGLGFFVDQLDGQRLVGHEGAVYGFASTVQALPDLGLAVAVVCTLDFANAVAETIARAALRSAAQLRSGEPPSPRPGAPTPLTTATARALAGTYRVGDNWVQLFERDGELFYDPDMGVRTRLRAADGELVSDDPLSLGSRRLRRTFAGLHDGSEDYVRDDAKPAPPPTELLPLCGEYGSDHNTLIVYEDRGRLAVLIEWLVRDLPTPIGPDRYVFPPGMYGGDPLTFERDATGAVIAATVAGARFPRRPDSPGGFRIQLARPIAELQRAAALATPPATEPGLLPSDLVDLASLDPTLRLDLRYATADNFVGTAVYPTDAKALLQRPAATALLAVHRSLAEHGLGLCVFDAYRPWSVTHVFWHATPLVQREFVADPAIGSRHNRGCAVDLTLYDLANGEVVAMPSAFDEFTPRAYPDYPGGTSQQRWYRELLRTAMVAGGFTQNPSEWWHFDHADWQRYPIGNQPLR
jgi:D-alanyl-D-alanine dipeptidase/CubicO group peptidase (beta-lactamase class C family)